MLMAAAADMCTMPGIRDTMDPPLPTRVLIFVPSSWKPILCFNLDALEIINSFTYKESAYVHQGWFSEDHTTLYADDELDEEGLTTGTDYSALLCHFDRLGRHQPPTQYYDPVPTLRSTTISTSRTGYYIYQAAYTSGLAFIKIMDDADPEEVLLMANKHVSARVGRTTVIATSLEYRSAIL
jgi:hypothetical protein